MSEEEKVTSPAKRFVPCAACRRLRRRCMQQCRFAPYFPAEDPDRFDAVHRVYGASNLSKLLAELPVDQRQDAVNSLVYEANARMRDPNYGCVSYLTVLENMLKQVRAQVDAARGELAGYVGPEAAFEPFDPAAAPREVRMAGEAQAASALEVAKEQDDWMRAMREADEVKGRGHTAAAQFVARVERRAAPRQKHRNPNQQMAEAPKSGSAAKPTREQEMTTRQAAAGQQQHHPAARHTGTGLGSPDGHGHPHPNQQMEEARKSDAAARTRRKKEMIMRRAAAGQQKHQPAAQHTGTVLGLPDGNGQGHPRQQMAEAENLAVEAEVTREQDMMMMMRQAAAAQEYHNPATAQHTGMRHGHPHAHQEMLQQMEKAQHSAAAAEAAREQPMMLRQAVVAQHAGTGLGLPDGNGHGHPRQQMAEAQNSAVAAEVVREQDMMMMMQQAAAAQEYHNPATAQHTGMRHGHPHAHQEMLQQMAEAQKLVTATEIARKQDMMMGQATAAQKYHHPAEQYNGMGHEQPHQQIVLQMAEAEQLAAVAEVGMEQGMMMRQAAATQQYQHPAAQYAAMRLDVTLGHEQPHAHQQTVLQMAQAQQMAAAAEVAREQDMMAQAQQLAAAAEVAREQDVMMRQAAAAQQYHHPAAQYAAMGLDVTLGQQTVLQMAQAQQLAAAAEVATEQDMMMQRAAAAQQYHNPAVQYAAMGLDVTLGHEQPHARQQTVLQMAQAQQLAAAAEVARKQQDMMMRQAALAELVREQEEMMMQQATAAQQQHHAAEQYAAMGLDVTMGHRHQDPQQQMVQQMAKEQQLAAAAEVARKQQDMMMRQAAMAELVREQEEMMMQQTMAAQQQHHAAEQDAAMGLDVTMGHRHQDPQQQMVQQMATEQQLVAAAELAREQEMMTMIMQQEAAYAHAVPETLQFLPGGSTDAAPFLVQQQPQSQEQTAMPLGFQMDPSLPPLPPLLRQPHAQLSRQQHTDGGDEGQSSDHMTYIGIRDPNLPPDGRRSRW